MLTVPCLLGALLCSASCSLNMPYLLSTLRPPRPELNPHPLLNQNPVNNLTSLEKLMKSNLSYGLMLAIALAGCSHLDKQPDTGVPVTQAPVPEAPSSESLELERPAPQLLPGNDQMVRMPPRRSA